VDPAHAFPRVILLTGPSGSGKSRLAARSGLPVLRLDDFYKEALPGVPLPLLPGATGTGASHVDWDSPASWDADAALTAITALSATGTAEVPVYDTAASAVRGHRTLSLDGARAFVAEGVFAAELAARCGESGLLADTLCLCRGRALTAALRFWRDVREARKPLPVLVRRGLRLARAERAFVERQLALGARACGMREALARIAAACGAAELPGPRAETAHV
jgi:uridine kinase